MYKKSLKKFDSELAQKQNKRAQFEELSEKELDEVVGASIAVPPWLLQFGLQFGLPIQDIEAVVIRNAPVCGHCGYVPIPVGPTIMFGSSVPEDYVSESFVNTSSFTS